MDSSILINERIYSLVLDHTNSMYQSIYVDNTSLPIAKMVNDIQNPTSFTILYIDTTVPIGTSWNVTVYYGTNTEWSGVLMYGKDNTTINGQLNITDNEQTISSTIPQYVSIGGSDVDIVPILVLMDPPPCITHMVYPLLPCMKDLYTLIAGWYYVPISISMVLPHSPT